MRTTIQFVLIIGIVLVIIFVFPGNHLLFSQNSTVQFSPIPTETINIVNPVTTQNVSSQDELIISGQSSDDNLKNCSVSVIVNNLKPYQNAVAKGPGGSNDFSQWEFVLSNTHIINGENKITSKLLCPTELTRWFSVLVNGVTSDGNQDKFSSVQPEEQQNKPNTNFSASNDISQVQPEEQQNKPNTNLSEADYIDTTNFSASNDISQVQPEEQQNKPNTNLSEASGIDSNNLSEASGIDSNNNGMLVSISVEKNTVGRGDRQNAIITVTDPDSIGIANAKIDGKLIYPGNNYEKQFNGITDSQGKFVYSWIIGKKGDVGALSIEIEVSSQGYPPSSATGSFDIVDNS